MLGELCVMQIWMININDIFQYNNKMEWIRNANYEIVCVSSSVAVIRKKWRRINLSVHERIVFGRLYYIKYIMWICMKRKMKINLYCQYSSEKKKRSFTDTKFRSLLANGCNHGNMITIQINIIIIAVDNRQLAFMLVGKR